MVASETESSASRHLQIRVRNSLLLTLKVIGELRNPAQFLDAARRQELMSNGRSQLGALVQPISDSTLLTEESISKDLIVRDIGEDRCLVSRSVPIAAVVFSPDTRIRFFHKMRDDRATPDDLQIKWRITAPTREKRIGINEDYPELGYRDNSGSKNKFQQRKNKSQSMGGMLVNNKTGRMEILTYDQLMGNANRQLAREEVLIMANWYMDSNNQNMVSDNETDLVPYNGVGILQNAQTSESVYFAINSGGTTYNVIKGAIGEPVYDNVYPMSKREVAAMCNLLQKRYGFDSWKIAGVDYTAGGTQPIKDIKQLFNQNFAIYGINKPTVNINV